MNIPNFDQKSSNPGFSGHKKPIEKVLNSLGITRTELNRNRGNTNCPAHKDTTPSLSIKETSDGTVLLHCHAGCQFDSILKALDLSRRDLFPSKFINSDWEAVYDYTDELGILRYQVIRKANKQFLQRRLDTANQDQWNWKMGNEPRLMYRLPRIRRSAKEKKPIYVVEGEKDVHTLESYGITATTNSGGAKKFERYADNLLSQFEGIPEVYILPDNDQPGHLHAIQIASRLRGNGINAKVIELPRLQAKEDVTDWFAKRNGSIEELDILVRSARYWEEGKSSSELEDLDDSPSPQNQSQFLLHLAEPFEFFRTPGNEGYAAIRSLDYSAVLPVDSETFKSLLVRDYYKEMRKPPCPQTLQKAINVLKSRAIFDSKEVKVHLRTAMESGIVYIDLGTKNGNVVQIGKDGWSVVEQSPIYFRRSKSMKPLPQPATIGDLNILRKHTGFDDDTHALLCAFLIASLIPMGPYPILIITGEKGSAKSTRTRQFRSLIDPSVLTTRAQPKSEQDFIIAAQNSHVLAFDNVSSVKAWFSDALCRLSTGSGWSTRKLYSDKEENIIYAKQPVILNGIEDFVTRADLLDRCVLLELPIIDERARKTEREVWNEYNKDLPTIFAGLLDAIATALANIDKVNLDKSPRMADFCRIAVAAEPAMGIPPGTFLRAYEENRKKGVDNAIYSDSVATAIIHMLEERDENTWEGSAGELIENLMLYLPEPSSPPRDFPKNPQGMAGCLKRIMPALRAVGIKRIDLPRTPTSRPFQLTKA